MPVVLCTLWYVVYWDTQEESYRHKNIVFIQEMVVCSLTQVYLKKVAYIVITVKVHKLYSYYM